MNIPAWLKHSAAVLIASAVCGCAHYRPSPLPTAPDLISAAQLTVPAGQLDVPGLTPHTVSPQGLDRTTVMTLAVLNNPDLKAARVQANVARVSGPSCGSPSRCSLASGCNPSSALS